MPSCSISNNKIHARVSTPPNHQNVFGLAHHVVALFNSMFSTVEFQQIDESNIRVFIAFRQLFPDLGLPPKYICFVMHKVSQTHYEIISSNHVLTPIEKEIVTSNKNEPLEFLTFYITIAPKEIIVDIEFLPNSIPPAMLPLLSGFTKKIFDKIDTFLKDYAG